MCKYFLILVLSYLITMWFLLDRCIGIQNLHQWCVVICVSIGFIVAVIASGLSFPHLEPKPSFLTDVMLSPFSHIALCENLCKLLFIWVEAISNSAAQGCD
jgi:hypothetical protein